MLNYLNQLENLESDPIVSKKKYKIIFALSATNSLGIKEISTIYVRILMITLGKYCIEFTNGGGSS